MQALPDVPPVAAVRRRRPRLLVGASVVVAAVLVLPLVFLLLQARQVGWGQLSALLFRQLTGTLLWNTVRLTVVVTAASAVIGTAAAWFVERTDLPGRRWWAVLVVIPVAIPDFVVSFGWVSMDPSLHGFFGAALVMTLAVYPLVYLPVAASFRGADPGQEEVAREPRPRSGPHLLARHPGPGPPGRARAAACWWRWPCWPSTGPSRSCATRPSPPRSSPSLQGGSTSPPPAACRWSSSCSASSS